MGCLSEYEVTAFVALVKHYMSMELRHRLMTELPHVYNVIMGRPIVVTVLACAHCETDLAPCACRSSERRTP